MTERVDLAHEDDRPLATLSFAEPGGGDWHDGPGWYYWDDDYPDEGSIGAFATREEAEQHAVEAGYRVASREPSP